MTNQSLSREETIQCPEPDCDFIAPVMKSLKSHYGQMHGPPYPYERKNPYGPNYHERRQEALERDEYTCQSCGSVSTRHGGDAVMHVHHKDEDKTNNDLGNLTTLCRSCHLSMHAKKEVEE